MRDMNAQDFAPISMLITQPIAMASAEEQLLDAIERLKEMAEAIHDGESILTMKMINMEIGEYLNRLD